MFSFLDPKSSWNLGVDRQEPPHSRHAESLQRRKNAHGERESSSTAFIRTESTIVWSFRKALLVACITAFLISMCSYDPSHSLPASQGIFSMVCIPTSKCLLRLYLPNVLVNPPAIIFVTSVLGFFTSVFVLHDIRRSDIYQDRILAFGVVCGSMLCGFLAFQGQGVSAFKNIMPGIIAASLATSAMVHTVLGKRSNV